MAEMDSEAAAKVALKYPQTIVGIKTAHFQPATWEAVDRAVEPNAKGKRDRHDGNEAG